MQVPFGYYCGMAKSPAKTSKDRFRKRNIRSQQDRDCFGNDLVKDMARAAAQENWTEYNRIKEILYRTT